MKYFNYANLRVNKKGYLMNRLKLTQEEKKDFLQNYWQKKPYLIRNAFSDFINPISPDELAGLSLENEVHSRIIKKTEGKFEQLEGPFEVDFFESIEGSDYSLLVQEVDTILEDVKEIKRQFRFLPDWRLDDVMISCANDGAGVGGHVDNYDVFLIQSHGSKIWDLGERLKETPEYVEESSVRVMKDFISICNYRVEPGDILYVPAMVPHDGKAVGVSMTMSVGFRSPSYAEIVSEVSEKVLRSLTESQRYTDRVLDLPYKNSCEIPSSVIEDLQSLLKTLMTDGNHIAASWGKLVTAPKRRDADQSLTEFIANEDLNVWQLELEKNLDLQKVYLWNEGSRIAFYRDVDAVKIFLDGETFELELDALEDVENFCNSLKLDQKSYETVKFMGFKKFLAALYGLNIIFLDSECDEDA